MTFTDNNSQSWVLPLALLGLYVVVFGVCAIAPYDRAVWWAENIPLMIVVGALLWLSLRYRFSNTAYLLVSVLIILHTIGGHFTFERMMSELMDGLKEINTDPENPASR